MKDLHLKGHNNKFLFKFKTFDEGQKILEDGPWFVNGHPMLQCLD